MPTHRIGAHTSIAGSFVNAAKEAIELGCNTFQIFSRSPRMWKAAPLDPADVENFQTICRERDLRPVAIHCSYLLNLASGEEAIRSRSVEGFRDEVERGLQLGAQYLVIHPGSSKGQEPVQAIETLARSFAEATRGVDWSRTEVLLENTAGGGNSLGRDFGELASIREAILAETPAAVGYCIDTCHAFAMGFDVSSEAGLEETVALMKRKLGLSRIKLIHANDSKAALASRLDRHEHIGEGQIGTEGFRRILNHPSLRRKPFILETPHGDDGTHQRNVDALKALVED